MSAASGRIGERCRVDDRRRRRLPGRVAALSWPTPLLAMISLTALMIAVGWASQDFGALLAIVSLLGFASMIASIFSFAMLAASCVARYNDLDSAECIRCGYPRPFEPIDELRACSECGLRPVEMIKPPLRWRVGSVVLHAIELAILIPFGFFCFSMLAMIDAVAHS